MSDNQEKLRKLEEYINEKALELDTKALKSLIKAAEELRKKLDETQ